MAKESVEAMKIAVIPARGGSKRIPRKNIRTFHGRPMIVYAIKTAEESRLFDRIIVSTDDLEIEEVSLRCGAEVLKRPKLLSGDYVTTAAVLEHALKKISCDLACCIYPCTPFLTAEDLEIGMLSVPSFAVKKYSPPIEKAFREEKGLMVARHPEYTETRTQDLPDAWHDAGQFYWVNVSDFLKNPVLLGEGFTGIDVPQAMDIDEPEDWGFAQMVWALETKG